MYNENTIELWKKRIKDREQSGLHVDDWCKANNFERHTYYYWYKRVKAANKSKSKTKNENKKAFVEVAPKKITSCENQTSKEIKNEIDITWKNCSIKLKTHNDIPVIAELMKHLESSC